MANPGATRRGDFAERKNIDMTVQISGELYARREELNAQLCALQSQHADITRELQLAENASPKGTVWP